MKKTILYTAIGLILSSNMALAAESQPQGVVMQPQVKSEVTQPNPPTAKTEMEIPKFDLVQRKNDLKKLIEQNKIKDESDLAYYLDKQDNGVLFNIDQKFAEQKLQYLKERQDIAVEKNKKEQEINQKIKDLTNQLYQLESETNIKLKVSKEQNQINSDFMGKVKEATIKDLANERSFIVNYTKKLLNEKK